MIPQEQLNKRAKKLYDEITKASVYIGDENKAGVILKKTIEENTVKVYISIDGSKGDINKIEIYDKDDEILQNYDMWIKKDPSFKFLAVCEIRVTNESI